MISKIKHLITATMVCGILLSSASSGHASDQADSAISLAKVIADRAKSESVTLRSETSQEMTAQRRLMNRLQDRNKEDISQLLIDAKIAGVSDIDLYKNNAILTIFESSEDEKLESIVHLEAATKSRAWQRKYLANLFLGSHFIHERDSLKALTYAKNALEAIPPANTSLAANDARYETYDLLHTAFAVDRNIDKMVEATKKLLEYGDITGRKIDHIPLIHNLGYVFSKSQDFETASQISELLMSIQDGEPDYQRTVANYSHGSNLLEADKFIEATPYLERASQLSGDTRFGFAAKIRLALAYAKTGQTKRSEDLIYYLENSTKERDTVKRMQRVLSLAKAENALQNRDYKNAYIYLDAWANSQAEELEALLSADRRRASEGLALSERVSREREARLQTEITMNKEIAKRGNMIAIFAGLLAVALAFIAFNLHRQRKRQVEINAELAIARDQALAGERAKASFLSMMGHELRTPMNPIISLAEILYTRIKDPETKQMLKMISASGRSMLSMVENILIVADETQRKLRISTQKTRVREFIRFTSQSYQRDAVEKGVHFDARIDPNVPEYLEIDKLKLRSIMSNILSNAVKFTDTGQILMTVMIVDDAYAGISMLLSIKDTGNGMTQEEIDNLRSIFRQRDASHTKAYDGVGVGLYVSELYTKAHGGRMVVSSHPQDGTRVDIYLPLREPQYPAAVDSSAQIAPTESTKTLPPSSDQQEAA